MYRSSLILFRKFSFVFYHIGAQLIILVFFLLIFPFSLKSQQLPNVIPPSPRMQQLQKYADYPTTSFTGVLPISIPIHTIKEGDIELPISINYHASGVKPSDPDGMLGVGWTLSLGGYVNRTEVGLSDFISNNYNDNFEQIPSVSYLDQLKTKVLQYPYLTEKYWQTLSLFDGTQNDINPDVYNYSCAGYSGKFVLRDWGQSDSVLLLTHKPVIIIPQKEGRCY